MTCRTRRQSPQLGDGDAVTIEVAGRGLGPAGSVQVPDDLWAQWADPHLQRAGEAAPTTPESSCLKVAALLRRLHADGPVDKCLLSPNARALVKYKSLAECELIIDMQAFNHACSFKARPFRLPSLEGIAGLLRSVQGGAWGAKIDLSNCYWSVHLPPAMVGAVRVAGQWPSGTTYALVRVPFSWHQALGLVQHLIAAVLSELPDTQVVIVQYLDDILFVGRDRQVTTRVARDTAAQLARKGFLVSPKSVLDATQSLTWMGKQLSLNRSRVAHKPEGLADIVGRWVTFSLGHYTRKPLQRLLGRIGWLARPGFSAGCFLAGARA